MRPIAPILLSLALVGTACSGGGDDTAGPTTTESPDDATGGSSGGVGAGSGFVRRLVPFDDCDTLLAHLKREAMARVGPYGLDGGGWPEPWLLDDVAVDREEAAGEPVPASDASAATDGALAGTEFTDTNVQELGVGEPDIIKTDGRRIVAISENVLTLVTLDGRPEIRDQIPLPEGWNHELFIEGDRAFVLTNGGSWGYPMPVEPMSTVEDSGMPVDEMIVDQKGPAALVLEIDLSDPGDLSITASMRVEGQYLSARAVGGTVRMAVSSGPEQLPWLYPTSPAAEQRAIEANRSVIDESTLDDWLPSYELNTADSSDEGSLLACDRTHSPTEFAGFDVVSIVEFDLAGGLAGALADRDAVGVLAGGDTVYSSLDRFYVATTTWAPPQLSEQDDIDEWIESYTTDVHAFAISDDEPTRYVASGSVDGSLLDQFSLDEHDGYLRVITTTGTPWSRSDVTETRLVVLDEDGEDLVEVGSVGGLGRGEQLYAARLLDDVGFAVTFRQIDPFYVLDLSDPRNPSISGELKIPGFSTYLHPAGPDRVLGVGQDADENGTTRGLKVSLFDVSDPSDPRELDVWTLPDANSPTEYDHRAFQMWGSTVLLPVQSWNGPFNGLAVLEVGASSISEIGRISHQSTARVPDGCRQLDLADVPTDSDLFWMLADGYPRVQLCDDGSLGSTADEYCDVFEADQLDWMIWEDGQRAAFVDLFDIEPLDRIEVCYPNQDWRVAIQRSLVIGDTIWTMSQRGLQANAIDGLSVTGWLGF